MKRIQITNNFYLEEFTQSDMATRMGQEVVVEVGSEIYGHIVHLCETFFQPLRDYLKRPITILSGYRPDWLNTAVGGSPTSDHPLGLAGDFTVEGMTPLEVCLAAQELGLPYKQLIHEFGGWTHGSVPMPGGDADRAELTAYKIGKRTKYKLGLHSMESLTNGGE